MSKVKLRVLWKTSNEQPYTLREAQKGKRFKKKKKLVALNSVNLGKEADTRFISPKGCKNNTEIYTEIRYNQIVKSQRQRVNFENERKVSYYAQRSFT